jgi:hypothetical protein
MSDRFHEINCKHDAIDLGEEPEKVFIEFPMFKLGDLIQRIKLKLLYVLQQDGGKNK